MWYVIGTTVYLAVLGLVIGFAHAAASLSPEERRLDDEADYLKHGRH